MEISILKMNMNHMKRTTPSLQNTIPLNLMMTMNNMKRNLNHLLMMFLMNNIEKILKAWIMVQMENLNMSLMNKTFRGLVREGVEEAMGAKPPWTSEIYGFQWISRPQQKCWAPPEKTKKLEPPPWRKSWQHLWKLKRSLSK